MPETEQTITVTVELPKDVYETLRSWTPGKLGRTPEDVLKALAAKLSRNEDLRALVDELVDGLVGEQAAQLSHAVNTLIGESVQWQRAMFEEFQRTPGVTPEAMDRMTALVQSNIQQMRERAIALLNG